MEQLNPGEPPAGVSVSDEPRKVGILDVLDVVCARGFVRAATRLCLTSKTVAAAAPMGTGRQVYDAAKSGNAEQLTTYLAYWRGNRDSPEVVNWAPAPLGIAVKVKKGQLIHAQFEDSPLRAAVVNDRLACVELLVSCAPDVDINKGRYTAPLHNASRLDHAEVVRALLGSPLTDVNKPTDIHLTALHIAAQNGHEEVARLLVAAKGIDVNKQDASCRTALHWAAAHGHSALVRILVAIKGIKLFIKCVDSPLDIAESEGYDDVVEILTEAKKSFELLAAVAFQIYDATDAGDTPRLRYLLQRWRGNKDVLNWDYDGPGESPMLTACRKGHLQAAKLLASTEGVLVNRAYGDYGFTPLMLSALNGHVDIVRFLVSIDGIDLNARVTGSWIEGRTALSFAKEDISADFWPNEHDPRAAEVVRTQKDQIAALLLSLGATE